MKAASPSRAALQIDTGGLAAAAGVIAQLLRNIDHVGILVDATPCRSAATRTKASGLDAAAGVIAGLSPNVDHPGFLVDAAP